MLEKINKTDQASNISLPLLLTLSHRLIRLTLPGRKKKEQQILFCVLKQIIKKLFVILSSALFHDENSKKQQVYLVEIA